MNGRMTLAAAIAAAILPFLPACTTVTAGHADINAAEWLEDYDAKVAAQDAEREQEKAAASTTAAPRPQQVPSEYLGISQDISAAATGVKSFWYRKGIDLGGVQVVMLDDPTDASCPPLRGAETDGWACGGSAESVNVHLPLMQKHAELGGRGYAWFLIGHEIGHVVISRRGISVTPAVEESLADCLAGSAAAGSGMGAETQRAVDAVYPSDNARHNAVRFGIEHGYEACIQVAK